TVPVLLGLASPKRLDFTSSSRATLPPMLQYPTYRFQCKSYGLFANVELPIIVR
ncbi:hypothetical protein HAX54_036448, partial [Datura stramonium]|nr:hypothetical protein [Datura stramonium]